MTKKLGISKFFCPIFAESLIKEFRTIRFRIYGGEMKQLLLVEIYAQLPIQKCI